MNRIEKLREYVDDFLLSRKRSIDIRHGFVHLYNVSLSCALIATKRGVNVELAIMAGMLHDLYTYKMKESVAPDKDKIEEIIKSHAVNGAILAREILNELEVTTTDETDAICSAIHNHNNKAEKSTELDEVLKDADVMAHCFNDPTKPVMSDKERYEKLLGEFDLYNFTNKH